MRALFADYPEACDNTLEVAERCNVQLRFGENLLPHFDVPDSHTLESWLRAEVERGAAERYGDPLPPDARDRIDYELQVIDQLGFAGYFLIVADLCRHAREHGIRVGPGRGSAAGSCVSYCLRITDLDPIAYGLMFERFLNPGRNEMPDIDLDFDERRRGDMIRYATEKYGADHVAQIVTFSTIKAKQAIRDSARVLGFPYKLGDDLAKAMPPPVLGKERSLSEAFKLSTELRTARDNDPEARQVLDTAAGLEGLRRQWGVHAAAVVISRDPLVEQVPIMKREADGAIITQYEMNGVAKLGLLKMDFLGLRNLTVLDDTLVHLRAKGVDLDLGALPTDDPATFKMLQAGDSDGVFQMESEGMRRLLRQLRPDRFEDIVALIALYRPGPMEEIPKYIAGKRDPRQVKHLHPLMEEITADTNGVLVYQEQIITLLQKVAGYTAGEADLVRKAIGKKIEALMRKEEPRFLAGCREKGLTDDQAATLWRLIQPFAGYSFNRAHAAGYGLVAWQTAYLKAHHPLEYMAALLTSVKDDKDARPKYLGSCRRMAITVLPPDVNESDSDFTPSDGKAIRYGLSAVRNVGEQVVEAIIAARREKGRFVDFFDFCEKVDVGVLNKRVIESLIKAGAFDSLGTPRRGLFEVHEVAVDRVTARKRAEAAGQFSLFGGLGDGEDVITEPLPSVGTEEWEKTQRLAFEKEMLGQYVSDHPLLGLEHVLARVGRRLAVVAHRALRRGRGHRGRDPGQADQEVHQAGRGLCHRRPRGPGRRGRVHLLPPGLHPAPGHPRPGRGGGGQGPGRRPRRDPQAGRPRGQAAQPGRARLGPGGPQPGGPGLQRRRRHPDQAHPRLPPRQVPGPPADPRRPLHHGGPPRRRVPGRPPQRPLRRDQGRAGPRRPVDLKPPRRRRHRRSWGPWGRAPHMDQGLRRVGFPVIRPIPRKGGGAWGTRCGA